MFILHAFLFVGNRLPVSPILGPSEDFSYLFLWISFMQFYGWREGWIYNRICKAVYVFMNRRAHLKALFLIN